MTNIWTISLMTFREAIRRRIVLTGILLGMCFLIIYSIGFHFIINQVATAASTIQTDEAKLALERIAHTEGANTLLLAGLYAVAFLSIAMGALLAADTLAGEISSGTIQTIVSKPIRRSDVVLGKWLGFALLLAVYFLLIGGGTMLSVLLQSGYSPHNWLPGLGLIYVESLLIMTISMACSSAFSALATGGIVFGLYGLAFIGSWIEQFGAIVQNPTAIKIGIIVSLIIPSESLWRRAAFEMQTPLAGVLGMSPFSAISIPSPLMVAYTMLYLLIILWLGIRTFQRRDL